MKNVEITALSDNELLSKAKSKLLYVEFYDLITLFIDPLIKQAKNKPLTDEDRQKLLNIINKEPRSYIRKHSAFMYEGKPHRFSHNYDYWLSPVKKKKPKNLRKPKVVLRKSKTNIK